MCIMVAYCFEFQLKKVKACAHIHCSHAHTHTQRHTNSESISVKLRIKESVNLARFPCQKQPVCTFAFAGFRRLFFHTLLFSPDNLMSIFFSSGIKTLWSSFSAFVLYEAAQWGWETHTTLRRSSVVLPTECPTNYQVQTRSYHSVFAAILWFGQCLYPLFFSLSLSLPLSFQTELLIEMDADRGGLLPLADDEANIQT